MSAGPGGYETLTVDHRGSVAEITLCRPDLLNRFDDPLHVELTRALDELDANRDVRVVVLASTGRAFSAGGDFDLMQAAHDTMVARQRIVDDGRALLAALLDLTQPIIAAVHADALGLGASVVLGCDAVVAAKGVRISDPHVCIGLVAGDGGCVVWPSSVGMLRAKRHLLTGDPLMAEDAFAFGAVTDLVDAAAEVLPTARALATRIAALPPLAVQGTKRALSSVLQQRSGEVTDLAFALETITLGSTDLLEAIRAFKERRTGDYEGT